MRARIEAAEAEIDTLNEQLSNPETASDYEKMMEITNKITEQKGACGQPDERLDGADALAGRKRRVTKGN